MNLFHITKEKYLPSILSHGLIINSNNTGFVGKYYIKNYYKKYGMQPIFLTNDYSFIIETQLTKLFLKDSVLLQINSSLILIEDEYNYDNIYFQVIYGSYQKMIENLKLNIGKTFICKHNINPELITVINNSEWKNTNN